MNDRDGGEDKERGRPADDAALAARLRDLGKQLDARHDAERQAGAGRASPSSAQGLGQALRLGAEFVAGVLVGAGIGWLVDRWLGTSPWGLIVFLLLGFAAGVMNVLRSAGLVRQPDLGAGRGPKGGNEE